MENFITVGTKVISWEIKEGYLIVNKLTKHKIVTQQFYKNIYRAMANGTIKVNNIADLEKHLSDMTWFRVNFEWLKELQDKYYFKGSKFLTMYGAVFLDLEDIKDFEEIEEIESNTFEVIQEAYGDKTIYKDGSTSWESIAD